MYILIKKIVIIGSKMFSSNVTIEISIIFTYMWSIQRTKEPKCTHIRDFILLFAK